MMALLSLVSCNKQELEDIVSHGDALEGQYMIELSTDGVRTKSSPSTVELNLADLLYASSKSVTAQLKKKTGSGWTNVTTGVSYAWSASSSDSKKFSGSGTNNQTCSVAALSAGSGKINVAASIGGSQVANQDVPVNVTDSRAISWTDAATDVTAGETKSATLNCNFSGTVKVASDNSDFLVGTSSSSLSTSASVTFSSGTTKTIYYKYNGTSEATVKMNAQEPNYASSANVSISAKVPLVKTFGVKQSASTSQVGPYGGYLVQFKIVNNSTSTATAKFHLIHRYNHASATTEGDRSVTLKAGEEQIFASIEYGGDSYIHFEGDIEGTGGDGGPTPNPDK